MAMKLSSPKQIRGRRGSLIQTGARRDLHVWVEVEGPGGNKHPLGTHEERSIFEDMVPIFNGFKKEKKNRFPQ
jgi:hypothetical protein